MSIKELESTTQLLSAHGKGLLAADESTPTITKRFQSIDIESSEETRRRYRELLISTPEFNRFIAGVILFEETLNQKTSQGISFPDALKKIGVVPGIKVDKGLIPLANTEAENITQGLDGLPERLAEYKSKGALFAKWRAVYAISAKTPSLLATETNAEVLARYAAICQANGIVPIVEPEILIDGEHSLARSYEVSVPVLHALFQALYRHQVKLEYIVLKPSMVINGKNAAEKASVMDVAKATVNVLRQTVPASVPTINFLSGGQSSEQATAHLNAMNQLGPLPWNLSYSYARALQDHCMKTWRGEEKNVAIAQKALFKRMKLNSLAAAGKYADNMEKEEVSMA
jgi:fructose-bisphosphate aldolase class I